LGEKRDPTSCSGSSTLGKGKLGGKKGSQDRLGESLGYLQDFPKRSRTKKGGGGQGGSNPNTDSGRDEKKQETVWVYFGEKKGEKGKVVPSPGVKRKWIKVN